MFWNKFPSQLREWELQVSLPRHLCCSVCVSKGATRPSRDSAPGLHEVRAVAETCQESHNTSEITNPGTSEGIHQIQPATSMVTKGNTEERDQNRKKSLGINPNFNADLIYIVVSEGFTHWSNVRFSFCVQFFPSLCS